MEDLSEDDEQADQGTHMLTVQIIQTDNTFLCPTTGFGLNVASGFDLDEHESTKFAQRIKLQDGPEALEQRPCIMALHGELLKTKPVYKSVDEGDQKGICIPKQLVSSEKTGSVLKIERLGIKSLRTHDIKHLEDAKQIANSTVGVLYGDENDAQTRLSVRANLSSLYAYRPHAKYIENNFNVEDIMRIESSENNFKIKTSNVPILLSYELSRERKPIALKQGHEFFFNNVDGLSIDGILPAGWKDEDFEAFKPNIKNWDLDCLNRPLNDSSLFKYFLLADLKNSADGKEIEMLDKAIRECFDSSKNLSRMMKIKKEYLLKIARKERPALLKLSVIRHYEELGLKKKIAEVVLFYASPAESADGAGKLSLKDKLKTQFLAKNNVLRLGRSTQAALPKIRNEFERSNVLYSVDSDFDVELGYSPLAGQFFLQTPDFGQQSSEGFHEPEHLAEIADNDYSTLLSDKYLEGFSVDRPRDGLWLPLPRDAEVRVPSQALLYYAGTIARVSTQPVLLV